MHGAGHTLVSMTTSPNDEGRLERLRRRIRNLDAALLGLIAERMELAREVGATKRSAGLPLRDFEVEKRVLDRAAEAAGGLGLAGDMARGIMSQLIEESCRLQEEEHYSASAVAAGEAETVLIVGGRGKMGGWFARFLRNQGHQVRVWERGDEPDLEVSLAGASFVLVAVSLDAVAETIDRVASSGFSGVVCDIASLKEHLRPPLERARAAGLRVTSIHPMFGPGARTLSDKVVCLCDCGDREATDRAAALFRDTAARLVELTLEEHDRLASYVLGLSHFVNLLFAGVLAESGLTRRELETVASTTFRGQLATAESVLAENPDLYYSIQRLNPRSPEVYREVQAAVERWAGVVLAGDAGGFATAMARGRDWLVRI
jgi:chorismate mutase/prephenate dehydrogenase